MPITLQVGTACLATLHEFSGADGTGEEMAPIGPVTYSSSDETVATVGATDGKVTAVAAGAATITGLDEGNSLSAADDVAVTAAAAQSAVLVLSSIEVQPILSKSRKSGKK